mmetsp:Transcript_17235/g.19807  ORF Transcript_17235/g.19807 Transcript_17235/m.19807 type:complete len:119 (+) Transcript_17235:617-973(+)
MDVEGVRSDTYFLHRVIAEVDHGMYVWTAERRGLVVTFAGWKDSGARLVVDDGIVMDLDYLQQNNRQLPQTPTSHRKRDLNASCRRMLVITSNWDLYITTMQTGGKSDAFQMQSQQGC